MKTINPKDIPTGELFGWLTSAVAPRPIAFASTIDKEGNVNLSPFSFFNVFSADPPIMIFSPSRRVRDNTTKHTLQNVMEVKEVVISMVNYAMVQQMSLSSTEYPLGVNEFEKAGFTQVASETISPPRVGESPVSFECKVNDIIHLGENGGAGNLVICEVQRIHVADEVIGENGKIDQAKLDAVARLGDNWYSRTNASSLFEVAKPLTTLGIGVDQIPKYIKSNPNLTKNHLGQLGNIEHLPTSREVAAAKELHKNKGDHELMRYIVVLLQRDEVYEAWKLLLN